MGECGIRLSKTREEEETCVASAIPRWRGRGRGGGGSKQFRLKVYIVKCVINKVVYRHVLCFSCFINMQIKKICSRV